MAATLPDRARRHVTGAGLAFALLLAAHGLAHFAGVGPNLESARDGTGADLLGGLWTTSSPAVLRTLAVAWAVVGSATLVAALLVAVRARPARTVVLAVTAASLVLSVLSLWAAVVGVVVDVVVLAIARRNSPALFATGHRPGEAVDVGAAHRFLDQHRLVVVGASTDPKKFGNTVYKALREHGYQVVPVNPKAAEVEGDACYPDVVDVPGVVDGVLIMVPGQAAVDAVHECAARDIHHVWLFRGLGGPGALSDEAVEACRRHDIDVVAGACPFMFLEPVEAVHQLHKGLRRFDGALDEHARAA